MKYKEYPLNTNYIAYEDGRIYSKRMKKFLTPKVNHDGYHRIQIWKNNKCNMIQWHKVIAETFLPKPSEKHTVVNHKDGDKTNNVVDNLEWVTQKENIAHAWSTGLSTRENHSKYKGFIVLDVITNEKNEYACLSEIADALQSSYFGVRNAWKKGKLYKNRYSIKLKCND